MKKAPGELVDLITHIMEGVDCERRVMFGFPVYFMNRNMFAGLFEDKVFFRLSVEQRRSLESKAGPVLNLEPMPGRAMKDYWVVPPKIVSDSVKLRSLAAAAVEHARSLAPKAPKKASRVSKNKAKQQG